MGASLHKPPPSPTSQQPAWTDDVWASAKDGSRRVFCNRSLNMGQVSSVGFDMDYTLAQYRSETFEGLAYQSTLDKLVKYFGYPSSLLDLEFDCTYMARGLVIDKLRGNILKVDRHKYVKVAQHGFRPLSREERLGAYHASTDREGFGEPDFVAIDTLFSLAEAYMFAQLVELKDEKEDSEELGVLAEKPYPQLYNDIRAAVDLCHRDGSLKQAVADNPEKYIHPDPGLRPMLEELRMSGKKTFVVTNSLWDFTTVVMNYLLEGKTGDQKDAAWLDLFDVVITGSRKPAFYRVGNPIFAVDPGTGQLSNTDDGTPMAMVGVEMPDAALAGAADGKVFQGGSFPVLHRILGVESGAEVLYVGDHIYGDILKSKKTLGWRTMLVVPELEDELKVASEQEDVGAALVSLRTKRDALEDQIQRIQWLLDRSKEASIAGGGGQSPRILAAAEQEEYTHQLEGLHAALAAARTEHTQRLGEFHAAFHPVWGSLMKTGYQNSQFASQVERFACLYSSHVGNLRFYSPNKSYRALQDEMPHDLL